MHEQAHALLKHVEETGRKAEIVMHDRDTKFTASFDDVLESADLEVKKSAHRSPNTVAFEKRPHQAKENDPLVPTPPADESKKKEGTATGRCPVTQIECRERLGGC